MKTYCICFKNPNADSKVILADGFKFEDAVQFALNLHRSSNTPHVIGVYLHGDSDSNSYVEFTAASAR